MPVASWAPLTAFAATLLIVWWLVRGRIAGVALDYPNDRSLHENPVPRTGGIGLHLGVLLAWAMIAPNLPDIVCFAYVTLFLVSLLDDLRGLPVITRFAAHLAAAGALAWIIVMPPLGWVVAVLVALGVAWMVNLYNFMDGSDGLAGGMAFFGFSFYGTAAWFSGSTAFALLNFSVAAAAAAFLTFNFHPARVFMGDVGSVPLGYLAAGFGVLGWLQQDWPWWYPLLLFSPFIVDASVTLARRLMSGKRVWEAHRDHYYQRLVQLGWGHRRTAIVEYAVMLSCGIAGLIALGSSGAVPVLVLGALALFYLLVVARIELSWRHHHPPAVR